MTLPWYWGSWASLASNLSAGGQLEHPWEVKSSTTAVRSESAAAAPEPPRGARTARTRARKESFRMVLMGSDLQGGGSLAPALMIRRDGPIGLHPWPTIPRISRPYFCTIVGP